jgi:cellulose synthase/poly-beta-1,6-N-acetylglucosamine synthase-like glycosyltransferase
MQIAQNVYPGKRIGERLLHAAVITHEQLIQALHEHNKVGVRVGQALLNLGYVSEKDLTETLAEQAGMPHVDARAVPVNPAVARLLPERAARLHGMLPLYDNRDAVVVACKEAPGNGDLAAVARYFDRPVRPVLVGASVWDELLDTLYRDEYLERSTTQLLSRSPQDSANRVLSRGQAAVLLALLIALVAGLVGAPVATLTAVATLTTAFYVGFSLYKFRLVYHSLVGATGLEIGPDEVAALDDRDLPIYTILVPVYHEAEVLPTLVKAIALLDYPKAKLDVKILLEEDDHETIRVARASDLPGYFKLVVVPQGMPKGKPKACNYGLIHAQGEYVVIYDAEDIPEPDQLKKALVAFRRSDERVACVQAKLNFFNSDQNLLTRWFTAEYSMWFDLFLPGLAASNAPIPLGGTSNHFKTDRLRELGAWDPYNVTEDADLGIRMYKSGWQTIVIDSTTYEEANPAFYNWIRQRSRWIKGYIQTYLVHMRHPLALWRAIGPGAFWSFQFTVGGTFFVLLLNPVLWLLTALWFVTHWITIQQIFPAPVFYAGALALFFGNFTFAFLSMTGCLKRGYHGLVKYGLLSPLYWIIMSIAAWKGFLQLFYAASYWEKTKHGLSRGPVAVVAARVGGEA